MKKLYVVLLSLLFVIAVTVPSFARVEYVGIVKSVSGDVFLTNPHSTVKAVPNMRIEQGDSIKTGPAGMIGLIFADDSVVSLGPNSEILIETFLFNPVDKELSFVTKMIRGTFSFITGQIAKLAPSKVILETPDATLGVRGTKLLVKVD